MIMGDELFSALKQIYTNLQHDIAIDSILSRFEVKTADIHEPLEGFSVAIKGQTPFAYIHRMECSGEQGIRYGVFYIPHSANACMSRIMEEYHNAIYIIDSLMDEVKAVYDKQVPVVGRIDHYKRGEKSFYVKKKGEPGISNVRALNEREAAFIVWYSFRDTVTNKPKGIFNPADYEVTPVRDELMVLDPNTPLETYMRYMCSDPRN